MGTMSLWVRLGGWWGWWCRWLGWWRVYCGKKYKERLICEAIFIIQMFVATEKVTIITSFLQKFQLSQSAKTCVTA